MGFITQLSGKVHDLDCDSRLCYLTKENKTKNSIRNMCNVSPGEYSNHIRSKILQSADSLQIYGSAVPIMIFEDLFTLTWNSYKAIQEWVISVSIYVYTIHHLGLASNLPR